MPVKHKNINMSHKTTQATELLDQLDGVNLPWDFGHLHLSSAGRAPPIGHVMEGASHERVNICHRIKYFMAMQVSINPQRPSASCHGNKQEEDRGVASTRTLMHFLFMCDISTDHATSRWVQSKSKLYQIDKDCMRIHEL